MVTQIVDIFILSNSSYDSIHLQVSPINSVDFNTKIICVAVVKANGLNVFMNGVLMSYIENSNNKVAVEICMLC